MFHLILHLLVPLALALACWRASWLVTWAWLLAGFVIDLDHLLADPIYDPERCSIGFHPLHSEYAFVIYLLVLACSLLNPLRKMASISINRWIPRLQIFVVGILVHLILDAIDCVF